MSEAQNVWRPITADKLAELLASELRTCLPEDAALFEKMRIEPKNIRFERGEVIEEVFAVGQLGKKILFYDDTEEGFEIAVPDDDGVIRFGGVGQFELRHALAQLRTGGR